MGPGPSVKTLGYCQKNGAFVGASVSNASWGIRSALGGSAGRVVENFLELGEVDRF